MSKIKKLSSAYEKYSISLEHRFTAVGPQIKATIIIPGENNTFTKRVSTNFITGTSLQNAEELAVDEAIEKLLGNKVTKRLVEAFKVFDLQTVPFDGLKEAPVGVKIILNVCYEDGKPYRQVVSLATGADAVAVEAEAMKSAVNKVLGV